MKLNLGCSNDIRAGYENVDLLPATEEIKQLIDAANSQQPTSYLAADLNHRWPWETSTVDFIFASHVFEHIHGRQQGWLLTGQPVSVVWPGKIHAMNEAWRVLKPGGVLEMLVPCVHLADPRQLNPSAFSDPTHANYWTFDDAFYYGEQFNTPAYERGRFGVAYGITALFDFPLMAENPDGLWHVLKGGGPWLWRVEEYGPRSAPRAQLHGILQAVKP